MKEEQEDAAAEARRGKIMTLVVASGVEKEIAQSWLLARGKKRRSDKKRKSDGWT